MSSMFLIERYDLGQLVFVSVISTDVVTDEEG